ncbi:hypothetical protein FIBSPDRAFT_151723 [Athelia psychrophila]|uniref:Uncharacterized protein n=1 Tax=Athelia psychrophila TaxID=1759441 RepID=A0A166BJ21_9AGAM|nr:hypothetical protein FIBSPDRAFT_151723 [Fibularhizoctonia sp. CBS 109695]
MEREELEELGHTLPVRLLSPLPSQHHRHLPLRPPPPLLLIFLTSQGLFSCCHDNSSFWRCGCAEQGGGKRLATVSALLFSHSVQRDKGNLSDVVVGRVWISLLVHFLLVASSLPEQCGSATVWSSLLSVLRSYHLAQQQ